MQLEGRAMSGRALVRQGLATLLVGVSVVTVAYLLALGGREADANIGAGLLSLLGLLLTGTGLVLAALGTVLSLFFKRKDKT